MVNNVVLSASIRSSIQAFDTIQRSIDTTSLHLATGLRVNSAVENPDNFFTSQALKTRANDIERLLDGIGQNIFVVEEASHGISALQGLLAQAEALSLQALEVLRNAPTTAILSGNVDLSDVTDLTLDPDIVAGQTIDVIAGDGEGGRRTATISIDAGNSIHSFLGRIEAARDNGTGESLEMEARLNSNGQIELRTGTDDFIRLQTSSGTATAATMQALGFDLVDQFGNITAVPDKEIRSQAIFNVNTNEIADGGDRVRDGAVTPIIRGEDGNLFHLIRTTDVGMSDNYLIGINDGPLEAFEFHAGNGIFGQGVSIDEIVGSINSNDNLNDSIEAEYDRRTGEIIIRRLSGDVRSINIRLFESGGDNMNSAFAFGSGAMDQTTGNGTNTTAESIVFGTIPPELLEPFTEGLNDLRQAIDDLIEDAAFRGNNLLKGEDLLTFFDASRTSRLLTQGVDFSAVGLGLGDIRLDHENSAEAGFQEIIAALKQVRSFGISLTNNLQILQHRQTFAENTIKTHLAGADDLTIADQNEEGAKLLASQTRQAVALSSLAFVQSPQVSILSVIGSGSSVFSGGF